MGTKSVKERLSYFMKAFEEFYNDPAFVSAVSNRLKGLNEKAREDVAKTIEAVMTSGDKASMERYFKEMRELFRNSGSGEASECLHHLMTLCTAMWTDHEVVAALLDQFKKLAAEKKQFYLESIKKGLSGEKELMLAHFKDGKAFMLSVIEKLS